jgi:hypothetical protein
MEIGNLSKFALIIVLVAMIVGVGVLVIDRLSTSDAAVIEKTGYNDSIVWPLLGANVTLDHGNITTFGYILNVSGNTMVAANYSIEASTGKVMALSNTTGIKTGQTVYAYYSWDDHNTESAVSLRAGRDALSEIATSWLSLIVLIGCIAIVLTMVIRSFGRAGGAR